MIQRQQSLWLLLACLASVLSFSNPFYVDNREEAAMLTYAELNGASNFWLLIMTGISVLLSGITIFLFKDRKAQLKLTIGGVVLAVLLFVVYVAEVSKFKDGSFALSAIFVLAILVGYIMAVRGIWKDEKLVKSLDKLR